MSPRTYSDSLFAADYRRCTGPRARPVPTAASPENARALLHIFAPELDDSVASGHRRGVRRLPVCHVASGQCYVGADRVHASRCVLFVECGVHLSVRQQWCGGRGKRNGCHSAAGRRRTDGGRLGVPVPVSVCLFQNAYILYIQQNNTKYL